MGAEKPHPRIQTALSILESGLFDPFETRRIAIVAGDSQLSGLAAWKAQRSAGEVAKLSEMEQWLVFFGVRRPLGLCAPGKTFSRPARCGLPGTQDDCPW